MQNAIMPSITIRDVPEATRDELAARAARSGRSLQQYLRSELIKLADKRDNLEIIERAQERARRTGTGLTIEQILSYKYADRADEEIKPGDAGR
jgi:plasmid stability protein